MIDVEKLVSLLNQPGRQSGTQLGKELGVSRVTIQKRIQTLIENGLPVIALPGRGYSLEDDVQLLDVAQITTQLTVPVESIEVLQSVESTNSHLLTQPISVGQARICVAETQRAGRGRRGSEWQSSPYRNVMLSLSWGFKHWPETITGLGLAVALSVAEIVNQQYGLEIKIKWPNDLMVGDDKLAGILVDVAGESSGACNVVIGLGLNVHQPDWSSSESYRWQDLAGLGVTVNRNTLIADIVSHWVRMLEEFEQNGFAHFASRWNALSSYRGRRIRVGDAADYVVGQMIGVDTVGALLLKDDDGMECRFADSNVSVRLVV